LVAENSPISVGLGGDGDEIVAIADVERAFGVKLDYSEPAGWRTAGDVFDSLQKALPAEDRDRPDLWERFTIALSAETGVDPQALECGSPLLSESRLWWTISNASATFWIVLVLGFAALVAVTLLTAH
jgi:hypothetical protein